MQVVCDKASMYENIISRQVLDSSQEQMCSSGGWGQLFLDVAGDKLNVSDYLLHYSLPKKKSLFVGIFKEYIDSINILTGECSDVLVDDFFSNRVVVAKGVTSIVDTSGFFLRRSEMILNEIEESTQILQCWIQKADIKKKCESFLDLPEGWDGYNARMITRNVIDDVIQFIDLIPSSLKLPRVGASAGNEILCKWKDRSNIVYISFFGDGKCHGYAKIDGEKDRKGNISISGGTIDEKILSWIKYF